MLSRYQPSTATSSSFRGKCLREEEARLVRTGLLPLSRLSLCRCFSVYPFTPTYQSCHVQRPTLSRRKNMRRRKRQHKASIDALGVGERERVLLRFRTVADAWLRERHALSLNRRASPV